MIRHQRVGGNSKLIIIRMIRVLPEGRSSKSSFISFIFFSRNIDHFVLLGEIELKLFSLYTCLPACHPHALHTFNSCRRGALNLSASVYAVHCLACREHVQTCAGLNK